MNSGDTIFAISSAIGAAARMIIRLSGPDGFGIARGIAPRGIALPLECLAGSATLEVLHIGEFRVKGWVYVFKAPHSYSGEDLIEFHIPGNPLLARYLVE